MKEPLSVDLAIDRYLRIVPVGYPAIREHCYKDEEGFASSRDNLRTISGGEQSCNDNYPNLI